MVILNETTTLPNEMATNSSSGEIRVELANLKELFSQHCNYDREDFKAINVRVDALVDEIRRIDKIIDGWDGTARTIKLVVSICMPIITAAVIAFVAKHWQ